MRPFVIKYCPSWVLCFAALLPAAVMMHPTFSSLLVLIWMFAVLTGARWVARMEGRAP